MDNLESWKSLLRALDSMPQSTSSEISFPFTAKASGNQECVINFSMNPLSNEWKESHVQRSPNIRIFGNLTSLSAMEEEDVTFGEKKTFVVGSEGGWRAINTVVELAGIELEKDEEVDEDIDGYEESDPELETEQVQENNVNDVFMDDAGSKVEDDGCSLNRGKRRAVSEDSNDESTIENTTDRLAKPINETDNLTPLSETSTDSLASSVTKRSNSRISHPKKKRKANRDKSDDCTTVSMSDPMTERSTTPIQAPTESDSAHLVEIARLCELMGKPTTTSSKSSEVESSNYPDPSTVPKIRLVRRKANKLQCKRCLDLGTACDTQTPCSPCKRLGRGMHVCRPSQEERDAVMDFASGKKGVEEKLVGERKELFFDKRGRFCKKEDAFRMVGEGGTSAIVDGDDKEV